ncbi:MAG: mycofactocin biosynthesis chaperone MftB [Acidimicrobiales bacterium]
MRGVLINAGTPPLDTAAHWELHPDVALRPEPFGALAYHYGSRRLTFLRSQLLAELVRDLGQYETADAALDDRVPHEERSAYRRALASLAQSRFIEAQRAP